jgi:hypothetical protein
MFTIFKLVKLRYIPLLCLYFAFGLASLSGISEVYFVKEQLDFTAEDLLVIAVWVSLPWVIKMLFGQFIDCIKPFRSARKSYIWISSALLVIHTLVMVAISGESAEWTYSVSRENLYILASLLSVVALVIQDVTADTMSVEVVEQGDRSEQSIQQELATVQLLGRLTLLFAMFIAALMQGWLAETLSYQEVFWLTLVIPVISLLGVSFVSITPSRSKSINHTILWGGIGFALLVLALEFSEIPYSQEIIFAVSLVTILYFLSTTTHRMTHQQKQSLIAAGVVIFAYRSMPNVGPGITWYQIDVLGFDKLFLGNLNQASLVLSLVATWWMSRWIIHAKISRVLIVITGVTTLLSLPMLGLYYGLHHWTEDYLGFGARSIAIIDSASSPFDQVAMVLMLTLIAKHAKGSESPGTFFALAASFMNLALTASSIGSKHLNGIWVVTRQRTDAVGQVILADYGQLGVIMWICLIAGLVLPLSIILVYKNRKSSSYF